MSVWETWLKACGDRQNFPPATPVGAPIWPASHKKDIRDIYIAASISFQNPKGRETLTWFIDVSLATAALFTGQVATIGTSFKTVNTVPASREPAMQQAFASALPMQPAAAA